MAIDLRYFLEDRGFWLFNSVSSIIFVLSLDTCVCACVDAYIHTYVREYIYRHIIHTTYHSHIDIATDLRKLIMA